LDPTLATEETSSDDAANSPRASHHHHSPKNNNNGYAQICHLEAMVAKARRARERALNHRLQEVSNIQYERANILFLNIFFLNVIAEGNQILRFSHF
jgi:hypothetical protein